MKIVLGLGSNLGDRLKYIREACSLLERELGRLERESSIIQTEPWGFESDSMFLNSVAVFVTDKTPREALRICNDIESRLGRVRDGKEKGYKSRTIDIDILFCDDMIIETDELTVPHPLIEYRSFVLEPLKEILPDFVHPVLSLRLDEIELKTGVFPDKSSVKNEKSRVQHSKSLTFYPEKSNFLP